MQRKSSGPFACLFGGAILSVVGFGVAFFLGKPILDTAKESRNWPSAPGVITHSSVGRERNNGSTMYSADIAYRFKVNDQDYVGNNITHGGNWSSSRPGSAKRTTARYPVGKDVDVYYDTEDPGRNVLEPGTSLSSYAVYGIGWLFLILGVWAMASSAFRILAGAAIIGGAAVGVLGSRRRSRDPRDLIDQPISDTLAPQPGGGTNPPGDDGFDMG
jgi:hypothetical protein